MPWVLGRPAGSGAAEAHRMSLSRVPRAVRWSVEQGFSHLFFVLLVPLQKQISCSLVRNPKRAVAPNAKWMVENQCSVMHPTVEMMIPSVSPATEFRLTETAAGTCLTRP